MDESLPCGETARVQAMRAFVNREHFRHRRCVFTPPRDDEFAIPDDWPIVVHAAQTPLLRRALVDWRDFLATCMGVRPGALRWNADGDARSCGLHLIPGAESDAPVNPRDPTFERFRLTVTAQGVALHARHERGILHATHALEWLLADRGAPYLACGEREQTPRFSPRLTNSIFIHGDQDPGDASPFDDAYLSLMSHFGANGIHLHANLWRYTRCTRLPELNTPDFDAHIAALNGIVARLLDHGLDAYLFLQVPALPADHVLFRRDPTLRGAPCKMWEGGADRHVLCSGHETVLAAYEEIVEQLFTAAPRLAGALMIVGGEGFQHCYTRPHGRGEHFTSCPNCRDVPPAPAVARLVNRVAAALRRTGVHKTLFAWPYSAFTWSGADRAQLAWIRELDDTVSLLANFDTNGVDAVNGAGVVFYDYNIKCLGPGEVFSAQAATAREAGRPIYAKVESNTTPTLFSVPYIPVLARWHERFRRMAATGVAGYVGQWRFYGMNGSPPEELQYRAVWEPERGTRELLAAMARRDFDLSPDAADAAAAGWMAMSAAWDHFPYSALTAGERAFYMTGPMHFGPAHPLIFNPLNRYGLSPRFFALRGDVAEIGDEALLREAVAAAPPRYIAELLIVHPYGVARYLELLGACRAQWSRGVAQLRAACGAQPTARARMELDVDEVVLAHLTTLEHTVRFLAARDALYRDPGDCEGLRRAVAGLREIVRAEIRQVEAVLPRVARDPRLGFGHCYGPVYDAALIRDKLRQCHLVLDEELPAFERGLRFHLWNDFE